MNTEPQSMTDESEEDRLIAKEREEQQAAYEATEAWIIQKTRELKPLTIRDLLVATFEGVVNSEDKGILVDHINFLSKSGAANCKACAASLCLAELLELGQSQMNALAWKTHRISYLACSWTAMNSSQSMRIRGQLEEIEFVINNFRYGTPIDMIRKFGSPDREIFETEVNCLFGLYAKSSFKVAMQDNMDFVYPEARDSEYNQRDMRQAAKGLLEYVNAYLPVGTYAKETNGTEKDNAD